MNNKILIWISNLSCKVLLLVTSIAVLVFQAFTLDSSEACTIDNERFDMVQYNYEYSKAFPTTTTSNTEARTNQLTTVAPKEHSNENDWINSVVDSVIGPSETDQLISTDKRAAIRELLDNLDLPKAIYSIMHNIITQIKQLIPIVESDFLSEKQVSFTQRDRLMQTLQKYCEKDICNKSIESLKTPDFWNNAVSAQSSAFSKYYTIEEIKDLTTFYKSSVGRKYLAVQPQVGHDIMEELLRKYASEVLRNVRTEVEKEVRNLLNTIE
ncbi:DUF2059 domain-containing protein [Candidatus Tremblaya phenacola]|uniref:DUF2059 domain-containing protein n=1 Tax=Candidatus Tremblayella phenacoccinincola TaxID=1010676 RepID=UPI00133112C1|nr:DUF2059 domain-containing protein [Candidatus Tremblaya phenacola]KAH0998317.1 hypothetical protein FKM95_000046 [Candidatus Tremblaya phenacola]